jgi:nucleotide-binding universal stress UspA family protein
MQIRHIVAATDESEAGRQAVWTAVELAASAGARVTVLRVVQIQARMVTGIAQTRPADDVDEELGSPAVDRLRRWVEADLPPIDRAPPMQYAVTFGVPGVEIARFAERVGADLLVLGRKPRSRMVRLLLGDTADAVARRSRLPCLFVPPAGTPPRDLLVAIDGSERGMAVLEAGDVFARTIGARLRVVTVDPDQAGELGALAASTPTTRSLGIRSRVRGVLRREVEVRRGQPVEAILAAVDEQAPDVLVLGCHRGGPAGIIEAGSTSRCLTHTAPCAVLTIPL